MHSARLLSFCLLLFSIAGFATEVPTNTAKTVRFINPSLSFELGDHQDFILHQVYGYVRFTSTDVQVGSSAARLVIGFHGSPFR